MLFLLPGTLFPSLFRWLILSYLSLILNVIFLEFVSSRYSPLRSLSFFTAFIVTCICFTYLLTYFYPSPHPTSPFVECKLHEGKILCLICDCISGTLNNSFLIYIYISIYVYIYTHTRIYIHVYTYIHIHTYPTYIWNIYIYTHTYIHIPIYIYLTLRLYIELFTSMVR